MTFDAHSIPTDSNPSATENARRIEELGRIIMAYSDVTDRLQQSHDQVLATVQQLSEELGEKNRLLERKQRLAALGEMAAGLAHEIRNPLGGIQLYASMLAKDVEDRPASHSMVLKISKGVKHLESLVGQFLQFSREMTATTVKTDLAEIVRAAVELATPARDSKAANVVVNGPEMLPIVADPLLLGQAMLNLVLNAIDAIDNAGTVTIDFGQDSEASQFRFIVTDNGPGIPQDILDRIFNPFFTTKDTGTGLGLSIVHRVVEAHDGSIIATNVDGGGARFEVRI